ncbi:MAG: hypothetical protein U9N43_04785 [Euryarchaeota archaeon]|nr:hypothetical protein [Euryarchaeota archaeon]
MMETMHNMDQLAARHAQNMVSNTQDKEKKLVETLDRLVTKTLGVLQEQGVYAMMLFLFSRTSDEAKITPVIRKELLEMVKQLPVFSDAAPTDKDRDKDILKFYINEVMDDLDTLFLVRDLYEQTLIYARFGAKAAGKEVENT